MWVCECVKRLNFKLWLHTVTRQLHSYSTVNRSLYNWQKTTDCAGRISQLLYLQAHSQAPPQQRKTRTNFQSCNIRIGMTPKQPRSAYRCGRWRRDLWTKNGLIVIDCHWSTITLWVFFLKTKDQAFAWMENFGWFCKVWDIPKYGTNWLYQRRSRTDPTPGLPTTPFLGPQMQGLRCQAFAHSPKMNERN